MVSPQLGITPPPYNGRGGAVSPEIGLLGGVYSDPTSTNVLVVGPKSVISMIYRRAEKNWIIRGGLIGGVIINWGDVTSTTTPL